MKKIIILAALVYINSSFALPNEATGTVYSGWTDGKEITVTLAIDGNHKRCIGFIGTDKVNFTWFGDNVMGYYDGRPVYFKVKEGSRLFGFIGDEPCRLQAEGTPDYPFLTVADTK